MDNLKNLYKALQIQHIRQKILPQLKREWKTNTKNKGHRIELKEFEDIQIDVINKSLLRLHDVAVTEFLKFCNNNVGFSPGPYREIDKYKLLLYQITVLDL